jgi:hypothetical protein
MLCCHLEVGAAFDVANGDVMLAWCFVLSCLLGALCSALCGVCCRGQPVHTLALFAASASERASVPQ